MKMLNNRQYECFEEMRGVTNISSLAPGFAGERVGARGRKYFRIEALRVLSHHSDLDPLFFKNER